MEPFTRNGGIIGQSMDFGNFDRYIVGEITTVSTVSYVGSAITAGVGTTSNITQSLTSLTGGSNSSPQEGDVVFVYFVKFCAENMMYFL